MKETRKIWKDATEVQRAFFDELKKVMDTTDLSTEELSEMIRYEACRASVEEARQSAREQAQELKTMWRGVFVDQYDQADYRFG